MAIKPNLRSQQKARLIKELKSTLGITYYEATHLRRAIDEGNWEHDLWNVIIKTDHDAMVLDYRMGIGHKGKNPDILTVLEGLASDYIFEEERGDQDDWIANFEHLYTISHKDYTRYERCFKICVKQSEDIDRLQLPDNWQEIVMEAAESL